MPNSFLRLENLTKTFPGVAEPAVENLQLSVGKGETVMLLGPSGCGKTTTLKMINRLIEPTSGHIIIDGHDVTDMDPNELRRSIGYVIQQGGLFPHWRVGDNVAAVLNLLHWPKAKISARVDEMLDLVGLDPSQYRDRYPRQLSGGQRQRVGVARALAADPLIMLLDEPFGAVDPIARENLQEEFLRLQKQISKTVVFVTHDLTEAIKMGDRIAILGKRSKVAQFDTPAQTLANPANDFVRDFLGSNTELRALSLLEVKSDMFSDFPSVTALPGETDTVQVQDANTVVLEAGRPIGWLMVDESGRRFVPIDPLTVDSRTTLADAVGQMMRSRAPAAIVVGADGRFEGCLEFAAVTRAVANASFNQSTRRKQDSEGSANAAYLS